MLSEERHSRPRDVGGRENLFHGIRLSSSIVVSSRRSLFDEQVHVDLSFIVRLGCRMFSSCVRSVRHGTERCTESDDCAIDGRKKKQVFHCPSHRCRR